MMHQLRIWAGFILLGMVILFTVQNVAVVEITFVVWTFTMPRAVLVFVILLIGMVAGWVLRSFRPARP